MSARTLQMKKPRDHPDVQDRGLIVSGFHEFNELAIKDPRLEKSAAPLSKRGLGAIITKAHTDYLLVAVALYGLYRYVDSY